MQDNKEVCEICLRRITNPICTRCYLKHVRSWLSDFDISEKESEKALELIERRLPKETLNNSACILCGKEAVSVCMYCAFLKTSPTLIRLGAGRKELKSYEESSNFSRESKMHRT